MSFFDCLTGTPVYPTCRQALVNLKSGTVLGGVIWERRAGYLVLKDARLVADRGTTLPKAQPIDGETPIPESSVDFIQLVGGG